MGDPHILCAGNGLGGLVGGEHAEGAVSRVLVLSRRDSS